MRGIILVVAVVLMTLGTLGQADADPWWQYRDAYPKAVMAVQNSSLGDERKQELLNMLEAGKKINYKSAIESNKRKAKKITKEAMAILNNVLNIVKTEG
jgi:hypothetical protein